MRTKIVPNFWATLYCTAPLYLVAPYQPFTFQPFKPTELGQLSLASLAPGSLNRVPALIGCGKGGWWVSR